MTSASLCDTLVANVLPYSRRLTFAESSPLLYGPDNIVVIMKSYLEYDRV